MRERREFSTAFKSPGHAAAALDNALCSNLHGEHHRMGHPLSRLKSFQNIYNALRLLHSVAGIIRALRSHVLRTGRAPVNQLRDLMLRMGHNARLHTPPGTCRPRQYPPLPHSTHTRAKTQKNSKKLKKTQKTAHLEFSVPKAKDISLLSGTIAAGKKGMPGWQLNVAANRKGTASSDEAPISRMMLASAWASVRVMS
jgi:hypothetical protein